MKCPYCENEMIKGRLELKVKYNEMDENTRVVFSPLDVREDLMDVIFEGGMFDTGLKQGQVEVLYAKPFEDKRSAQSYYCKQCYMVMASTKY